MLQKKYSYKFIALILFVHSSVFCCVTNIEDSNSNVQAEAQTKKESATIENLKSDNYFLKLLYPTTLVLVMIGFYKLKTQYIDTQNQNIALKNDIELMKSFR